MPISRHLHADCRDASAANLALGRLLCVVLLAGLSMLAAASASGEEEQAKPATQKQITEEQIKFFEDQVQPILRQHCLKCHGGQPKVKGGLHLTSRAAVLRGGETGAAVLLDKPDKSLLLSAINYEEYEMPPAGKLPQQKIDTLTRWVKMGLPWTPGSEPPGTDPPEEHEFVIRAEEKDWWSYRPLVRPPLPKIDQPGWITNPIDHFILARLQQRGLSPNPSADKVKLLRRAYFDLTGLPPTPEAVDAFVADDSPQAYEKVIDRLLESKHYGEKWGRHWLDLVRYAESHGYERDSTKPFAWRYRDYVIDSLNQDKPYDQFMREQIAGDELDEVTAETLTATGYYRLGIWDDEPVDREQARFDMLDDVVSTTAQVFLGMSLGCARCHNHKKDPIPQEDYYRLLAFFRDVTYMDKSNTRTIMDSRQQALIAARQAAKDAREEQLYRDIFRLEEAFKLALAEKRPEIRIDEVPASDLVELKYRFYRDTWETLPDFAPLRPETEGLLAQNLITLAPASRQEAIGLVFQGRLRVPADGKYTFHLDTTDGSRLVVDGKVVDEQTSRGNHQRDVRVELKRGLVPLRLDYFHNVGRPKLKVAWSGPDFARKSLSSDTPLDEPRTLLADSRDKPQSWSYTFNQPASDWAAADFDDSKWKQGPGGFGRRGTPGSVVGTDWHGREIWLRRGLMLDDVPGELAVDLHHDEDVEIYLNGQSVLERKRFTVKYHRVPLDPAAAAALKPGRNVMAVHCRQSTGGQYIDVGLLETNRQPAIVDLLRKHGPAAIGAEKTARYFELKKQLDQSRSTKLQSAAALEVMAVKERGTAPTHVLIRGNAHARGKQVEPGFPQVLDPPEVVIPPQRTKHDTSGRRQALCDWLTDKQNPLTSRVLANRFWQHHFGRGICPTPNDFGRLGQLPTHPELLDWLATELVEGGWRLKRMHKLIMLSSAYRMSSADNPQALQADPANELFWRFNMRRLTAEEIRDAILFTIGSLNPKLGGPSFFPQVSPAVLAGASRPGAVWGNSSAEERKRRSVYIFIKRSLLPPELSNFDFADTDSSCAERFTTTVPTQSLNLLNSPFMSQQSAVFAARLKREAGEAAADQVRRGLRLALGRVPRDEDVRRGVKLIDDWRNKDSLSADKALEYYCLLLLNLNEFVFVD